MRRMWLLFILGGIALIPAQVAAQGMVPPGGGEEVPVPALPPIAAKPVKPTLHDLGFVARSGYLSYWQTWHETETQRFSWLVSPFSRGCGSRCETGNGIRVGVLAEQYLGRGFAASLALESALTTTRLASSPLSVLNANAGVQWYPLSGCELMLGYDLLKGPILSWSYLP